MPVILKILLCFILIVSVTQSTAGRKVRQSLKIEKTSGKDKEKKSLEHIEGKEIKGGESAAVYSGGHQVMFHTDSIRFSGYEKEANANTEAFLVTNRSEAHISGIRIRITYRDMNGDMLDSRNVTKKYFIPAGETRKVDIPSWDKQHTYFYYLGNEPRKIATPYKVEITLLSVWLE